MIGFFIGANIAIYIMAVINYSENKNVSIGFMVASGLYAIAAAICGAGE